VTPARSRRVVVVGAGIGGLSTAHALLSASTPDLPIEVTVLEASGRAGGKLHSIELDGMPVEAGADSFVVRKPWAVELCKELGLEDEVVIPGSMGAYVWTRGELVPFPDRAPFGIPADVGELLRWQGLPRGQKLRALLDLVRPAARAGVDEPLGTLLRRRLGSGVATVMVEPLLAGLHAGDPLELSAEATFPELRVWERRNGSLLRGARAAARAAREEKGRQPMFATVWGGLSRLAERLVERIGGDRVRLDHPVSGIEPVRGAYRVRAAGRDALADAVVVATPAFEVARLLSGLSSAAAKELGGIPYVSTAVVLAAYPPGTAEQIPEGTGFVVPAGQATITACTWISRKWPNEAFGDRAVLRSFVGRAGDESALRFTDAELAAKVADDVEAAVGIGSLPVASRVVRWNRSMPQYQVGHLERIGRIEAALAKSPGVFVTGSAFRGVGIADCVREGRETAQGVVAYLRSGATDRAIGESPPGDLEQEAISWTS
jgi:protoporphyrinogen/coproporphyrinogen III oxidase